MPLGTRRRMVLTPPTTSVCPAFAPPWKRTTTSAHEVKRSTIFPLPSSPHCAPTLTTLDMDRSLSWSEPHLLHLPHVGEAAQPVEHLGGRRDVHVDQRQRFPALAVARQGELRDVHLRLAERAPDVADDAGLVVVVQDEDRALGDRFQLE